MKIAILGLGSIGRRHGRNFQAIGGSTIIGFDPSAERRAAFEAEVVATTTADIEDAVAAADLVCVCSPNRFHTDQALLAAKAGKALFIEKPVGIALAPVAELRRVVAEKGLFAHVGSNWKFHPAFVTMKRLLGEGRVGRVVAAQVLAGQWLPDWHPWEDYRNMYSSRAELGGGIVLDSHEFDYLPWLLGPVTEVKAFTRNSGALEIDTEDCACVAMRLAGGILATIQVDYIQREYRRRYHICGDGGTLEWDMASGQVRLFDARSKTAETFDCTPPDINDMYVAQARHVLAGARGGASPVTDLAAAEAVLKVLLQIKESG